MRVCPHVHTCAVCYAPVLTPELSLYFCILHSWFPLRRARRCHGNPGFCTQAQREDHIVVKAMQLRSSGSRTHTQAHRAQRWSMYTHLPALLRPLPTSTSISAVGGLFSHSPTAALQACATILDYHVTLQLVSSFSVMWECCGTLLSPPPGLEL